MTKELPDVFVTALEAEEGKVAEIDALFAHFDVHLHGNVLEPVDETLTEILEVVIAKNEIDLPIQAIENLGPFGCSTQAEVAQVENCIVGCYDAVPIRN